jgi:hypothetical protein
VSPCAGGGARQVMLEELSLAHNELENLHGMSWPAGLLRFSAAHNQIARIGRAPARRPAYPTPPLRMHWPPADAMHLSMHAWETAPGS